ncbi:MRN complex-interacting protein [Antennarius striatus]|uniref:MRN complex-interacting protein n=1 Tax=Antennarius striatus TaxID=241820 RepID=UPI0035ADDB9A
MVQEFHVLRCFSCQSFQVQQVKKAHRWSCKLCGEKQSLLKEFGRGSGADCRRHVQKLNAMRGAAMEEQECNTLLLWEKVEAKGANEPQEQGDDKVTQTLGSRWTKYLDTPDEAEPQMIEENILMDRQQLHGNNRTDRKRKRRDERADRQGQDGRTPEQSNWLSQPVQSTTTTDHNHTGEPSTRHTSHTSVNRPSHTSLNCTSGPIKNQLRPPSVTSGPESRWARFLSSDCQETALEPSVSGRSQFNDVFDKIPPIEKLRPLSHVSMFQTDDDFGFDEFLTTDVS